VAPDERPLLASMCVGVYMHSKSITNTALEVQKKFNLMALGESPLPASMFVGVCLWVYIYTTNLSRTPLFKGIKQFDLMALGERPLPVPMCAGVWRVDAGG